jgi:hypothetical protein
MTFLTAAGLNHDRVKNAVTQFVGTNGDAAALRSIGIDLDAIRAKLEERFGPGALDDVPPARPRGLFRRRPPARVSHHQQQASAGLSGHIPFTPRAKKVLELSLREAVRLKHKTIGSEHILLGLIREGEGLAALIMADANVDVGHLRRAVEDSFRDAA